MRFSLQDVRKSVQRRGEEYAVQLYFLRPGEMQNEIARLIACYEQAVGQRQASFSADEARACIGEYRLANCLMATLSYWYKWQSPEWAEVVLGMEGEGVDYAALLTFSPMSFRLALYSYVNTHYQGFLSLEQRSTALENFGEPYGLRVEQLEYLLALDMEGEAQLVRESRQAPTVQEVATLYNQWVFEVALCNASQVSFVIDCQIFSQTSLAPDSAESLPATRVATGMGAVIKRLTYLARKMGVYYDISQIAARRPGDAPLLLLLLYGPQEVTGAPQQYGLRLARFCRLLFLQYPKAERSAGGHNQGTRERDKARATLGGAVQEAEARVHFLQRAYRFALDARLFRLLQPVEQRTDAFEQPDSAASTLVFDSSVEQSFAEAFIASAQSRAVDGWQLEREPEPLVTEHGIFIPDFAFTRGQHRIYVEILGFWTPTYRERKLQKLQDLRGRVDIVLILPADAREAFASIAHDFPLIFYEKQISVSDVLHVLRQRYDDFAERLQRLALPEICQQIHQAGLIREYDCYHLLNCYRRDEIQRAAQRVTQSDERLIFAPGLGIYARSWLARVHSLCRDYLAALQAAEIALGDLADWLRRQEPALQRCEESAIETLLCLCPELSVKRDSLFAATVALLDQQATLLPELEADAEQYRLDVTSKVVREKKPSRSVGKKRVAPEPEAIQHNLL